MFEDSVTFSVLPINSSRFLCNPWVLFTQERSFQKRSLPNTVSWFSVARTEPYFYFLVDLNKLLPSPHKPATQLTPKATAVSRRGDSPSSPSPRNLGSSENNIYSNLECQGSFLQIELLGDMGYGEATPHIHTPTYKPYIHNNYDHPAIASLLFFRI